MKALQGLSHEIPLHVEKTWELDKAGEGGIDVGWGDWLEETEITGIGTKSIDILIKELWEAQGTQIVNAGQL